MSLSFDVVIRGSRIDCFFPFFFVFFYLEVGVGATPGGQGRRIVWVLVSATKKHSNKKSKKATEVGIEPLPCSPRIERSYRLTPPPNSLQEANYNKCSMLRQNEALDGCLTPWVTAPYNKYSMLRQNEALDGCLTPWLTAPCIKTTAIFKKPKQAFTLT